MVNVPSISGDRLLRVLLFFKRCACPVVDNTPTLPYGMESVKQHRYARLSSAAYNYPQNMSEVRRILKGFGPTHVLEIDTDLSTEEHLIVYDIATNEVTVAFRGTVPTNPKDLATDARILAGTQKTTERYKDSIALMQQVQMKYGQMEGVPRVTVCGHSLGGGIAAYVAKQYPGIDAHVFNAALSWDDVFGQSDDEQSLLESGQYGTMHVYSTPLDPVSSIQFNILHHDQHTNRRMPIRTYQVQNGIQVDPHSLEGNFWDKRAIHLEQDNVMHTAHTKETAEETYAHQVMRVNQLYTGTRKTHSKMRDALNQWHSILDGKQQRKQIRIDEGPAANKTIAFDTVKLAVKMTKHAKKNPDDYQGFHEKLSENLGNMTSGYTPTPGVDAAYLFNDGQVMQKDIRNPTIEQRFASWIVGGVASLFGSDLAHTMEVRQQAAVFEYNHGL